MPPLVPPVLRRPLTIPRRLPCPRAHGHLLMDTRPEREWSGGRAEPGEHFARRTDWER